MNRHRNNQSDRDGAGHCRPTAPPAPRQPRQHDAAVSAKGVYYLRGKTSLDEQFLYFRDAATGADSEVMPYPEPLVWSTTKDDRVGPQHARKFAARLEQLGHPYLFYEVIEGGHGAGATLDEQSAMGAREFVYFARQLALP